jgi:hypothetical protein
VPKEGPPVSGGEFRETGGKYPARRRLEGREPPRIGPDISHFRAARIAPHSHRLSLATKKAPRVRRGRSGGALAGRCEGATQPSGLLQHESGRLGSARRGPKKKPRRGVNRAGFPRAMTAAVCSPPALRAQLTEVLQKTEHPNEKEPAGGGLSRCASRGRRGQSQDRDRGQIIRARRPAGSHCFG